MQLARRLRLSGKSQGRLHQYLENSKYGQVRQCFRRRNGRRKPPRSLATRRRRDQRKSLGSSHREGRLRYQSVHLVHHILHHRFSHPQATSLAKPYVWLQVHQNERHWPVLIRYQIHPQARWRGRPRPRMPGPHHQNAKHNVNYSRNVWQR